MKTFSEFYNIREVRNETLEKLSSIEHDQWMDWATSLMKSEELSDERIKRWRKMMVPYDELPDDIKEYDREYARKVMDVLNINEGKCANQMFVQAKALKMLGVTNSEVINKLIEIYGAVFRNIINEFECKLHRLPTADDLIWIAGVHTGKDPRVVAKELMNELKK